MKNCNAKREQKELRPGFRRKSGLGLGLMAAALPGMLLPATGFAQQKEAYDLSLEEIIVTAQKREQNSMDVPVSIHTFTSKDIELTGANNIQDISDFIPGLSVSGGSTTQTTINIRGISSSGISTGGDPSVATIYDGAYVPRAATTMAFSDTQSVEVLKGPQGTLFGRNASAGVINIVPNSPGENLEGFLKVKAGNLNLQRYEAMINVPLSDSLFLRANALTNRRDGFIENVGSDGGDPGEQDNMTARVSLLWKASADTDLQFSYDWDKVDQAPRMAIGLSPEFSYGKGDPFASKVANDVEGGEETRDMYTVSVKLNHQFNDEAKLFAVTSYRDFEVTNRQDEDGTDRIDRYFDTNNIEDSSIFYSEVRFHYDTDKIHWVTGANYSSEDVSQITELKSYTDSMIINTANFITEGTPLYGQVENLWDPNVFSFFAEQVFGIAIPPEAIAASGDTYYNVINDAVASAINPLVILPPSLAGIPWVEAMYNTGDFTSMAIFSDLSYEISDTLEVAVGLRYSKNEKAYTWYYGENSINEYLPGTPNLFLSQPATEQTLSASDEWSKVTGRAVMNWHFSDSAMTFVSYTTGYKSGGFDALQLESSLEAFEPEEITNAEWGIKGDLFEDKLRVEFGLFHQELINRQTQVSTKPPGRAVALATIINGDLNVTGAEVVLQWQLAETLRLGFSTTYREQDSSTESYYNSNGDFVESHDTEGRTGEEYTYRFDWTPKVPTGSLLIHADYVFKENNSALDINFVEDYNNYPHVGDDKKYLSARAAWTNNEGDIEVALWGRNLLDNKYAGTPGGYAVSGLRTPHTSIEAPLTWGVDVGYFF